MLQAELRVVGGRHHNHVIPLSTSKFLIGREHDCQLRPTSESVSRHHCVFTIDDFTVRIRDLGSTNGTLVNGEQVRGQVILQSGDRVTVGKLEFIVEIHETADVGNSHKNDVELPDEFSHLEDANAETMMLNTEDLAPEEVKPYEEQSSVHNESGVETGVFGADTTIINPGQGTPTEMPQGVPGAQPGMPPYGMQLPYNQPYGGYPPPGYPGYGYPSMPMFMPPYGMQPMYPPQGMPYPQGMATEQQTVAPTKEKSKSASDVEAVKLPPPETTGYVAPPPKPAEEPNQQAEGEKKENPSEKAANIIRQFMQRRPGSPS